MKESTSKKSEYSIRPAKTDDIDTIVAHRRGMLEEIRSGDMSLLDSTLSAFKQWVIPLMKSGEYLGWFGILPGGEVVSGLGLWTQEWIPSEHSKSNLRGYILNVFTDPAHRKHGLARLLTQTALDYCRSNGIEIIVLHASQFGKPLYESLGFTPTADMRLILPKE